MKHLASNEFHRQDSRRLTCVREVLMESRMGQRSLAFLSSESVRGGTPVTARPMADVVSMGIERTCQCPSTTYVQVVAYDRLLSTSSSSFSTPPSRLPDPGY